MAKSLIEVLGEQGIELIDSSSGRKVAHCCFHEGDSEPSFTVYGNGTYYCFGCKAWGDAYKFLCDKGWSHKEAIEYLGEDYKLVSKERPGVIKLKNFWEAYRLLSDTAQAYHQFLCQSRGPYQYLLDRGISEQTINTYRLGYTDGFVLRLYWAYETAIAERVGLISRSGHEVLGHRISVPNQFDSGGNIHVDFLVGRTVVAKEKVKYLGIRLPKPLYGFYEIRSSPVVFVTEGQFDWLTLRQWGYPAVSVGGGGNTQLLALADKNVIIVPDNDTAGKNTAESMKAKLPDSVILDYSKLGVKDVNELAVMANGRDDFASIVGEQITWTIPTLQPQMGFVT